MSLIDVTYFFNEFDIAQKQSPAVAERLQYYIDTYEVEYLEKALGEDFAALFNASVADPKYDDLQEMLKSKPSPIAAYVFYMYQRDEAIVSTGEGDARSKSENAARISETYRMTKAWNIMVRLTRRIHAYLNKNSDIFPEFGLAYTDYYLSRNQNDFGLL